MKKILRITALILLSLTLIISLASCGAPSASSAAGDCGAGLTWSYDSETKVLSISGNGKMTDYASSTDLPWATAKYSVETVTVSSGVEHIGDYAFYGFTALKNVNLPDTVVSVGKYSFAYSTALTSASLPSALTSLGDGAFEGCSALEAAFIPASVTSVGKNIFAFCYSATDAAVLANVAVPAGTFFNCRSLEHILLNSAITDEMIDAEAFSGASLTAADAKRTESTTADATLTVKYVDTEGNELSPDVTKENISYGGSYSVVSPKVEGYTADKLTVSGNLYGQNETVTVTYTKDAPAETAPVTDEAPEDTDDGVNASTIISIVILVLVLAAIGVGAFMFARSEKKNANKTTTVRKNNNKDKKRK